MTASIISIPASLARWWHRATTRRPGFHPAMLTRTDADDILNPLLILGMKEESRLLVEDRFVQVGSKTYSLPRFAVWGDIPPDPAVHVGLLGGLDPHSLDTVRAAAHVLTAIDEQPALGRGFHLAAYPKANVQAFLPFRPASWESFTYRTLQSPTEEDGRILREELRAGHYSLIIRLRSDRTSRHLHARVRGDRFARTVVTPALLQHADRLPISTDPVRALPGKERTGRGWFRSRNSQQRLVDVELYAPAILREEERADALAEVVLTILENYRGLLTFQRHLRDQI